MTISKHFRSAVLLGASLSLLGCAQEDADDLVDPATELGEAITTRFAAGTIAVATASLNVRTGGATSFPIIGSIARGTRVTLIDGAPVRGWYRVRSARIEGWSSGTYLQTTAPPDPPPASASASVTATMRWHVDIHAPVDTTVDADVFDVDLFDTSESDIRALRARGRTVLCYFSAGSYEDWRSDRGAFDARDLGRPMDTASGGTLWEGERWLDSRSERVRRVMLARLDLARAKGCHGVDPDNVDAWDGNNSGFAITASNSLDYLRFLSREARSRGLLIGLKNNFNQVAELVDQFDFAVSEQCFQHGECDREMPFIRQNKGVFEIEYEDEGGGRAACPDGNGRGFFTLIAPQNQMDGRGFRCR